MVNPSVDKDLIKQAVYDNFSISSNHRIYVDDEGMVHLDGHVWDTKRHFQGKLPVRFHTVKGNFHLESEALESLSGCPINVMGNFSCINCELTSLKEGPKHVYGFYSAAHNHLTDLAGAPQTVTRMMTVTDNPLTSLEGLSPGIKQLKLSYNSKLPLLRLLELPEGFQILDPDADDDFYEESSWQKILEPFMDEGRKGAIKAAAELIRAGYKENARW